MRSWVPMKQRITLESTTSRICIRGRAAPGLEHYAGLVDIPAEQLQVLAKQGHFFYLGLSHGGCTIDVHWGEDRALPTDAEALGPPRLLHSSDGSLLLSTLHSNADGSGSVGQCLVAPHLRGTRHAVQGFVVSDSGPGWSREAIFDAHAGKAEAAHYRRFVVCIHTATVVATLAATLGGFLVLPGFLLPFFGGLATLIGVMAVAECWVSRNPRLRQLRELHDAATRQAQAEHRPDIVLLLREARPTEELQDGWIELGPALGSTSRPPSATPEAAANKAVVRGMKMLAIADLLSIPASALLATLGWHFFLFLLYVALPIGMLAALGYRSGVAKAPRPLSGTHFALLGLTALTLLPAALYTLYKAATLRWGGH
jgi:hypothetical protein